MFKINKTEIYTLVEELETCNDNDEKFVIIAKLLKLITDELYNPFL